MKKFNRQEIPEVDDCPGYGRIHKGLLDAACDLALRKRGVRESVYWPRRNRSTRRKEKEGR